MKAGCPTGFSIDGPKGPRYVAKMGAVQLAKKTGNPIIPFTLTAARYFTIRSWDQLQIPCPFTRALVDIAPPIYVPEDASEETLQVKRNEVQEALNEVCARGDQWRRI